MNRKLSPVLPGEILLEEFLKSAGLTQTQLARALGVPSARINGIVHGRRGITPDSAARLAGYFGTSPGLWINLQARHDAKIAQRDLMPATAKRIRPHTGAAA